MHFYRIDTRLIDELLVGRPVVYISHLLLTTEPWEVTSHFNHDPESEMYLRAWCGRADVIVCVSEAERVKLKAIFPEYVEKLKFIHNGMYFEDKDILESKVREERKIFGFIGRLDYRKGVLECLAGFKRINGKLLIAGVKGKERIPFFVPLML